MTGPEPILDAAVPIIDPHHHLWLETPASLSARPAGNPYAHVRARVPRYLFEEVLADATAGHHVVATVYAECGSMFRADGPAALGPVGEVEFANGVAAMSASGRFGSVRLCAGIVGHADLGRGDRVEPLLAAQIAAGGGRFRGIRQVSAHDARLPLFAASDPGLLAGPDFQEGLRRLAALGLSFDAWMLEPQLPTLIALARAVPEATIILNHAGTPLGYGAYEGTRGERFAPWRNSIRDLAGCPNVVVKIGGLGMPICGFPSFRQCPPAGSRQLADEWRPYVETCIAAFGADRCMFESNYPTDAGTADYRTLWNAFKRLAASASDREKAALFAGTAARIYRLDHGTGSTNAPHHASSA